MRYGTNTFDPAETRPHPLGQSGGRTRHRGTGPGSRRAALPHRGGILPAGEPVVQLCAVLRGAVGAAGVRRYAGLLPPGRPCGLLGGGGALFLLGAGAARFRLRLGLRQLPRQAVQRRGGLCCRPGGGLRVHLRLLRRGLHQFHHPVHRVSLLPDGPHRRQLCVQSGVLRPAQPDGAAGGRGHQGGADAPGEEPVLLLSHRLFVAAHLPVFADERDAGPAGLVRPHLCLRHSGADAGLPL